MEVVQLEYQIPVVILTHSVMLAPVFVIQDTMITMAPVAIMLEYVHQVSINLTLLHLTDNQANKLSLELELKQDQTMPELYSFT